MFSFQPSDRFKNCDNKFCNNIQIPCLPIRGPKPFDQILFYIHKSIVDEATAIEFYCHLLKECPGKIHREFIEGIIEDEREHLDIFTKLFCYYTDEIPKYDCKPIGFPCYKEGLLLAMLGELEAVEFYRNVQLSTTDQLIIDIYFMVMVDEQSHATLFSTLLGSSKC